MAAFVGGRIASVRKLCPADGSSADPVGKLAVLRVDCQKSPWLMTKKPDHAGLNPTYRTHPDPNDHD
jgi:hypothetical protein